MYQLVFYVPTEQLESVKQAVFAEGAGRYRHYDQCCWQTNGEGQFRPLANSQPAIGKPGEIAKVKETKVEMICEKEHIHAVIQALKHAHPYEEPAFHFWEIITDLA